MIAIGGIFRARPRRRPAPSKPFTNRLSQAFARKSPKTANYPMPRSSGSSMPPMASLGSPPMSNPCVKLLAYAERMQAEGRYGETEDLLTRIGVGEYLAQIFGGIPMSQGEFVRLGDFGLRPRSRRAQALAGDRKFDRRRKYSAKSGAVGRSHRSRRGLGDRRLARDSMRRWKRSARKFANMRKPKSSHTPMNGI